MYYGYLYVYILPFSKWSGIDSSHLRIALPIAPVQDLAQETARATSFAFIGGQIISQWLMMMNLVDFRTLNPSYNMTTWLQYSIIYTLLVLISSIYIW